MKKIYPLSFFLCLSLIPTFAQQGTGHGIVGFYNLENLFDTVDDPTIDDAEFLPQGKNQWTDERYQIKLGNMSKVIAFFNPDILGVSEIENRKVLEDLVLHPNIAARRYQIIHFDMSDARGVDVAFLYKPSVFKPFLVKRIPIHDPEEPNFKTRDILWVKGLFLGDTLHVVVNHWPSRAGSDRETKRLIAAKTLRAAVDSVLSKNPKSNIVMMGDFNDDPNNKSIKKVLLASDDVSRKNTIINTSEPTFKKGFGTLAYNGAWNLFDQMFISSSLTDGVGIDYLENSFTVFFQRWMQEEDGRYKGTPKRTFRSGAFNPEGFSDHFPVHLTIRKTSLLK